MSNYTKTTNFGAKDTLPSGDSQKIVRGSEFDTEFNAISTAIATKLESGSSSADVNFLQSGTGAVTRTVQSKLRDVVSVKDFGAVGDGTTNDTTAVQNAINSGSTVYFPAGTYAVGAITTTGNLKIVGVGTLAMTGSLTIADAATQVIIEGLSFTKGNNIGVFQGASGNLTTVRIQNASVTGGYGFHFLGSAANVEVSGCSFSSLSVTSSSVQAVKIGNNDYADSAISNYIRITNNRVAGVTNSTSAETHAFLIYGTDIAISNNTIEGVYHASTACEAIYTKGVRVAITGNTIKNCGPSEDGCIAVKGTDYGDTSSPRGYGCVISGNVVSYDTNNTTQVRGISSAIQNASIVGNVPRNTFISVSGQNNLVDGNLVDIVADTYTPKAFVAEITKPDIRVSNNKFRVVSSNLNSNTISAAYVRATAGYPVERFDFSNNDCRVVWSGVTSGGSNYLAFFELWCDGATIDAQVRNNTFRVETPNITNTRSVVPYVYSGASNLTATFMDNRIITVDPVGGGYRTFRPFGSGTATVYFQNNRSNVVPIVGANVGLVMSYDVDVTNIDATAARTLYLPSPAALGSRLRIVAANRTHNIVIDPNGTTWADGSTSAKTLSSKGFVELQVYETGYWTVTSLSGTLT